MPNTRIPRNPFGPVLFLVLLALAIAPAAFAQNDQDPDAVPPTPPNLAYSDLGPRNSYSGDHGLGESGGTASGKSRIYAMPFQVDSSYTYYMSQVNVALNLVSGPGAVSIVFAQDHGGVPGPAISAVSGTIGSTYGSCCSLVSVTYPHSDRNHIALSPGTTYWIETVLPEGEAAVWNLNIEGQLGTGAVSTDGGTTWAPTTVGLLGAFSVYGYVLIQG